MKSVIKLLNMESEKDVKIIQSIIADNMGVIASQVSLAKKEVVIIYNGSLFNKEKFVESIEDLGYVVMQG